MPPVIRLEQGDITQYRVDAIVNAANSRLSGGGGVDGAIHKAAGSKLYEACQKIYREQGECPSGHAVITPAFQLLARYVIHAVGPIWDPESQGPEFTGDERSREERQRWELEKKEELFRTYQSSLKLALEYTCKSIAFPTISTGAYGFPKEPAANIALSAIKDFCDREPASKEVFESIYLVCFDEENFSIYRDIFSS